MSEHVTIIFISRLLVDFVISATLSVNLCSGVYCLLLLRSGPNGDWNPDLCNARPVLHQLSYQANWEQVITWGDYKPVEVEIDDHNTGILHAFELRIGMNEFDHCSCNPAHYFSTFD